MNGDQHSSCGQLNGFGSEMLCKKREDYLEWPEYFMAVAFLSAQRSKDPNSQVGACIVNSENKIVGIGYNGMPNGCSDDLLPWTRTAQSKLDTKYPYGLQLGRTFRRTAQRPHPAKCQGPALMCHAELNAIMNKNSADVKGCSMYVALFPCNECAKLIIQAGIKEVIFMSDKYHDSPEMTAARRLFDLTGIIYRKFKPKCNKIIIDFDSINGRPSQKPL
ncbi:deoxycytidylate deaminase isoform X1 [Dermochelys coriacea]|uniref:deoxycytidylate deaminase isoform X1 n=1 Tax=Dermochelys coriacea TaxID=27794 RepID=UPI001CA84DED|nr:deoxycytidylate deaminase isoform X1 [Dermochelys coriacea]